MSDVKLCSFCGSETRCVNDACPSQIPDDRNTRPAPALTPKQEAADEMAKALTEANAWISRGDGLSPAKRGATCDTLNEAVEMIESVLAKAGQP